MDETANNQTEICGMKRGPGRPRKESALDALPAIAAAADPAAVAYAARVWDGQSPDLPVADRVARVLRALDAQQLNPDGVVVGGVAL